MIDSSSRGTCVLKPALIQQVMLKTSSAGRTVSTAAAPQTTGCKSVSPPGIPPSPPSPPLPSRACQAPWAGHGWQSAWKPADVVPDERRAAWRKLLFCSRVWRQTRILWLWAPPPNKDYYRKVIYIFCACKVHFQAFFIRNLHRFSSYSITKVLDLVFFLVLLTLAVQTYTPPPSLNPPQARGGTSVNTVSKFPDNKGAADHAALSLVAARWACPVQAPVAASCQAAELQRKKHPGNKEIK